MRGHWNLLLEPNYVAETPGALKSVFDPSAEPVTPEEAAEQAAQEAADHAQNMLATFDLIEEKIVNGIMSGRGYKGRYFSLHPSVRGVVLPGQPFNEAEHKVGLTCSINAKMKSLLSTIKLTVKGQKDFEDFAKINAVEDAVSKTRNELITIGDDILVTGERIKIMGNDENGLKEQGIGVFFIPETGAAVQSTRLIQNEKSFINVRVPKTLTPDKLYTLRIVTRYSNGTNILVSPRSVDFHGKLKAVSETNAEKIAEQNEKNNAEKQKDKKK
jgi:hypothetical protein